MSKSYYNYSLIDAAGYATNVLYLSNNTVKIIDANMKELHLPTMYFSKIPEVRTLLSDDKLNVIGIFKNQLMCYELQLN